MTKKRGHPTVTQDLAREVYLGLQGARSLKALNAALRKRHGDGAPSFRTLESWCRKGKWVAAAKEYDVRLAKSVAEEIHKQAVAGTVVHVVKLRELSIKLIEKALSALPKVPVEELSQLEASVRVASAALDKSEVLAGGVSDRKGQEGEADSALDTFFEGLKASKDGSKAVH